ncbi:MAG: hypothetical protein JNK82_34770 [Myxococcaceae bacterium]|nr:hypothetical protein [Myxococcaceae bacterium]
MRGHVTEEHDDRRLQRVEAREGRPSDIAVPLDGLIDEMFDDAVCEFAHTYYCPERYFEDLERAVMANAGPSRPPDSWASFDRLVPVLDRRFAELTD